MEIRMKSDEEREVIFSDEAIDNDNYIEIYIGDCSDKHSVIVSLEEVFVAVQAFNTKRMERLKRESYMK